MAAMLTKFMKTLHLKLKRDVLIVDLPEGQRGFDSYDQIKSHPELSKLVKSKGWTFLCQGTPTEEQAAELVEQSIHTKLFSHYVKDIPVNTFCYKSAVESFLSAISAQNWNWMVNPMGEEPRSYSEVMDGVSADELLDDLKDWQECESRTFKNPYIFIKE